MDYSSAQEVLDVFKFCSKEIKDKISGLELYNLTKKKPGQYNFDVIAEEVALPIIEKLGFSILSEESGIVINKGYPFVIVDPIDGSTNLAKGLPYYATSLALVEPTGPVVSYVINHATSEAYHAIKDNGAYLNGVGIKVSSLTELSESFLAISGYPPNYLGWKQFRSLGAASLEICQVASARFDGFIDCSLSGLGPWDYLGAMLVLEEAGGYISEIASQDLVTTLPSAMRHVIATCNKELADAVVSKAGELKINKVIYSLKKDLVRLAKANPEVKSAAKFALSTLSSKHLTPQYSKIHFTGSALIISNKKVVLHKHRILNTWIQPGGHLDVLEAPWEAAIRESYEETGLNAKHVKEGPQLIWVALRSGIKDHLHIDLTYLCEAPIEKPRPSVDESQEVGWFDLKKAKELAPTDVVQILDWVESQWI
jgi:myo-inositol-1(or 4)-monophosphatase